MTREAVTSFSSGTEGDKGKEDHTYEMLPIEANEEEQQNTTHGGQEDTADVGQGITADDVPVYANQ